MSKKANYQNFYKPKNQVDTKEPETITGEIVESNQNDISKEIDKPQGLRSKINAVDEWLSDDVVTEPQEEEIIESNQEEESVLTEVSPKGVTEHTIDEYIPKKAIVVNAKRVNMRMDVSKDAPVKKVLSQGTEVAILEKSTNGVWSKIKHDSDVGFMMSQYLKEIK